LAIGSNGDSCADYCIGLIPIGYAAIRLIPKGFIPNRFYLCNIIDTYLPCDGQSFTWFP
jgi:hypothetical protein